MTTTMPFQKSVQNGYVECKTLDAFLGDRTVGAVIGVGIHSESRLFDINLIFLLVAINDPT